MDTSVKILEPRSQVLHSGCSTRLPRPTVHFDNAAHYPSAVSENYFQSCQFRHAPSSNEIRTCDFLLFGDLKTKLKDEELENMEELRDRVKESLNPVTPETPRRGHDTGSGD
jgi:hypothetical protein